MKSTRKMKILSVLMSAAMVFGTMPASIAMAAENDDIVQNSENTDDVSADDTGMDFTLSAYEEPTEDTTGDPVVEETVPESGEGEFIEGTYTEDEDTESVEAVPEDTPAEAETDVNEYGTQMLDTMYAYYMDADGELQNVDATEVTNSDTEWTSGDVNGGWYVVYGDIDITDRITVSGKVNLILVDDCTLTASEGITVQGDNSLTIYGQTAGSGKLEAETSDWNNAAIGGANGQNCGVVTINGGTVNSTTTRTLEGYASGAGIGGGSWGSGGTINISGGKVTASAGSYGAGIGGGFAGAGGTINISGGTVTAAGDSGAGIGGGSWGSGEDITISGGTVTAAGNDGAGIGGGDYGNGGDITISGGTVTAQSTFSGAGIGGGDHEAGGDITISGGIVTASSGSLGAGIGGGAVGAGGIININGGTVTAQSGTYGAGIGGGSFEAGGIINISGGIVTASAGTYGAGIGGGYSGRSGSFTTGDNGNAFIVASSISDQSGKPDDWRGAIIAGGEGQVYQSLTLALDAEIPEGEILLIPEGTSLTIESDATLTNNGTVYQDWGGVFTKEGTYTDNGEDFYGVKIDVYYYWISSQYKVEYKEKTYLPPDKNITLWRDTGPYIWDVLLLGQSGNTVALTTQGSEGAQFTMPAEPVHLVQSIDIPEADQTVFTYNGNPQTYTLKESEYYTIEGNVQTDAGTYTVTVSLVDPTIYAWKDGTTEDKTYPFVINPEDDNDVPVPSDRNNIKTETTVTVTAADLVYNGTRQNAGIVVTAKDGTVLEKGVDYILDGQTAKAAGTHKATLTGIGNYYGTTTVNYKIAKDSQKLTAKVKKTGTKKYTVKASKLKNDSRTFKIKVTKKGKMKVRYSTNNSRIKVDKNGKVTLKKGLKAGTYKIKVTTGASRNYKASKTPKYITVKVK